MTTSTETHLAVEWMLWSPEVFERARREDKLIVLDIGATWCHWCHVMDRVTYEDPQVADLLNKRFVPVRVDRDRLIDVDAHYQQALPVVPSRGGGWPLTVVITPEGHVLFKATFLPPRAGGEFDALVGLVDLLDGLDQHWRQNRQQIIQAGEEIRRGLAAQRAEHFSRQGEPSAQQVRDILSGIKASYDSAHGGTRGAPKFFNATAIELLLAAGWAGDGDALTMASQTLEQIGRGGVYDQVGGGFHRYSVDERWHVPHFEKMAYDNAAMLACYADAYALTGRGDFARIARQTLEFCGEVLLGEPAGGFFASQDADVGPDDDGDYFTWTADEVRAALGEQADIALEYYGIDAPGDMPDRPGRNVLHVPKTLAQIARLVGKDEAGLAQSLQAAHSKLLATRRRRRAPAVDRTVFADLNGMMIDAFLTACDRLGDLDARGKALAALDGLLATMRDERGVFAHYRQDGVLQRVGLLADQAWMARALVHAYCATGQEDYLHAAQAAMDYVLARLAASDGGFMEAPVDLAVAGQAAMPARRNWNDAPCRSAGSVAAQVLVDLGYLTDRAEYSQAAAKALASFAGGVQKDWGTFLAGYGLACDYLLNGPRSVVIVGPAGDTVSQQLIQTARKAYIPGGLVIALDPARTQDARMLHRLGQQAQPRPLAYVCQAGTCLAPASTTGELVGRFEQLKSLYQTSGTLDGLRHIA